ncbi:hypothetical protein N7488_004453 [Penicillium malachiteum]|nr:hypothetical protein N7488_004453 [Penicillium malachiteum]
MPVPKIKAAARAATSERHFCRPCFMSAISQFDPAEDGPQLEVACTYGSSGTAKCSNCRSKNINCDPVSAMMIGQFHDFALLRSFLAHFDSGGDLYEDDDFAKDLRPLLHTAIFDIGFHVLHRETISSPTTKTIMKPPRPNSARP